MNGNIFVVFPPPIFPLALSHECSLGGGGGFSKRHLNYQYLKKAIRPTSAMLGSTFPTANWVLIG